MPGKVLLLKITFKNNFVMNLKPNFVIISLLFLSNCNIVEISQFLKSEGGQKSVESGFNIKQEQRDDWKIIQW